MSVKAGRTCARLTFPSSKPQYRATGMPVKPASAGTEACATAGAVTESIRDDGAVAPAGDAPLPQGALGRWVAMPDTTVEHGQGAARIVGSSLYVVGGCTANCAGGAPTLTGTVDRAAITGAAVGPFTAAVNLQTARRQH